MYLLLGSPHLKLERRPGTLPRGLYSRNNNPRHLLFLILGEPTKVIKTRNFQGFVTKCNLLLIMLTNYKIYKNLFFL